MIAIDGEKFVAIIGFGKETFTAQMMALRLMELGTAEVNRIMNVCTIHDTERASFVYPELLIDKEFLELSYTGSDFQTPEYIKKQIKHSKNPLEKIQLQKELNASYKHWNANSGRRKGK